MRTGSISYSTIADRYEQLRGGNGRATELAEAMRPWLPDGVVCDVGAGTDSIAARHFSHLWDLTASTWEMFVEPAINELRSLPNPDQIRQRTFQHPLVVLTKQ
jgi:hypothetical protein